MEYKKYVVELKFRNRILGGIPKDPKLIEGWLKGQGVTSEEARKEIAEEMEDEVEWDPEKSNWSTFKRDDDGVYIEARQLEALLKECMDTLDINKGKGSVARKQTMQHGLFVKPPKIHLKRVSDGEETELIGEPDGYIEKPIHIMGFRGPRSALTRKDYVEKATVEFEIWVTLPSGRKNPHIREGHLEDVLELGQENGIGASRTQGYGKYDLLSFEELD